MHRIYLVPRILIVGLILGLGLGAAASRSFGQPPPPPPPGGAEDKEKTIRIPVDQSKYLQMFSRLKITKASNDNPKVVKIENVPDNPFVIKLTGVQAGWAFLILTDEKNNQEIREVHVLDSDDELFQLERKKLERKRATLLEMIHKAVPTANVDVVLGITRNRVTNDNSILTGSVILTGTVFETEKIQLIIDLANAVFAGNANQTTANPLGVPPGTPYGTNTLITPATGYGQGGNIGGAGGFQPLGNRIAIVNNLRLGGVQQVELGVVVALVNRTEARNLGFNWVNNGPDWFLSSFISPAVSVSNTLATALAGASATNAASGNQLALGVLSQKNGFTAFLQALRTENLVKILSEPRVMTLSGRPANFIDGGQIPVITNSTGGSTVSYLQFGTVVNFVPIVLGNGKIHLEVAASISSPDSSVGVSIATAGSLASAPGLKTRGAQVAVQLEDGQTLAIGGLIQNTVNAQTSKIPVIGDAPFIGTFFRAVTYSEDEEELLILVTPRLVDPMACTQLPKYLPGRDTRVADDFELFLEGIMEAPRGQRNVFPGNRFLSYTAAHQIPGSNNENYSCGDSANPHWAGKLSGLGQGAGCASCQNGACGVVSGTLQPTTTNNAIVPTPMASPATDRAAITFPAGNNSALPLPASALPGQAPAATTLPSLGPVQLEPR